MDPKRINIIYPFWVLTTHPYLHLSLGLSCRGCQCVTMGTYLTNSQSKQEGPKPNFDVLPIVIPKWKVQLSPLSFRNPFHYFSPLLANVHGFVIMLVVPKSLYISHAWRWAIYFHETYISAILPKEPTFEGVFYVFMGKKLCLFVHMVKVSKNRNVPSKVFYKNIFVFLP